MDMPRPRPPGLHHERTRHGKWCWYVRIGHGKRYLIDFEFGTQAFNEQYHACYQEALDAAPKRTEARTVHKGSLAWLVELWTESSDFKLTARATQQQRLNILSRIMADNPGLRFADITEDAIEAGRERRMDRPAAANNYLKTMRALFGWAKARKLVDVDPAKPVKFLPHKGDGHLAWDFADVAIYRSK